MCNLNIVITAYFKNLTKQIKQIDMKKLKLRKHKKNVKIK